MNISANKICIMSKWFILLLVLHTGIFNGRSEDVVISSGILNETMFNRDRPVLQESSSNEFRATVSMDGKWAFEVRPIHKEGDPLYGKEDSIYLTFDGTDTFFCQYSEAIIGITNGRPGIIGTASITNRPQLGYISAGNYPFSPFDGQKRTQVLWLMYGAGKYLEDNKPESIPLPWIAARQDLLSYGFRLKYEALPESPYFPTNLVFIRDSKLDFQDEDSEYKRPELDRLGDEEYAQRLQDELKQRKTKWHDGAIAGQLKTDEFTNFNDFQFPLSFKFETFLYSGKLRRLYVATVTNITYTNIENSDLKATLNPPILSEIAVFDSRFRLNSSTQTIDHIFYNIKTGERWLPKESDILQKYFSTLRSHPEFLVGQKPIDISKISIEIKRWIIIAILLILTVVPLIFLAKNYFQARK